MLFSKPVALAICSGPERNRKVPLWRHSRPRRFSANGRFSGIAFWYSPGEWGTGKTAMETGAKRADDFETLQKSA
jgi:hypothetical protein